MMIPDIPDAMKKMRVKILIKALNLTFFIYDASQHSVAFFPTKRVGSLRKTSHFISR